MRWTEDEYKEFLLKVKAEDSRAVPQSKRAARQVVAADTKREKETTDSGKSCYRIVIISKRVNALNFDSDNVVAKWAIDEMVKAGLLENDSTAYVESTLKMCKKVETAAEEETIIEVYQEWRSK